MEAAAVAGAGGSGRETGRGMWEEMLGRAAGAGCGRRRLGGAQAQGVGGDAGRARVRAPGVGAVTSPAMEGCRVARDAVNLRAWG